MFKNLRVRKPVKNEAGLESDPSIQQLIWDASLPVTIKAINSLPENPKLRLYRALIPLEILSEFDINPRSWKNPDGSVQVRMHAPKGSGKVSITAWYGEDPDDPFFVVELGDNSFNGIDLNFLILNNPTSEKYRTDYDDEGHYTHFGTAHRNLAEEQRAMAAGLAPGQVRSGIRGAARVFAHLESFLTVMTHHAVFLEPLTYASAWVFERKGFAYVRGHKLMDTIHKEFQPGGALHQALDASTPFRHPDHWRSVRGRAWAIHDGVLDAIDQKWDGLRMIKQVGKHAGVNTFPDSIY